MLHPLSIYIHIPFCTKKCPYCHFYVIGDNERLKDMLLQALIHEIGSISSMLQNRPLVSIYFGGGTPSLFGPNRIEKVLTLFSFDRSCEITLEANPEESTQDMIQDYRSIGINRLSFGVQSFQESELKLLGRLHSGEQAKKAIHDAFNAGIENITLDLMYETPKQTLDTFKHSLYTATSLPISHLSLYNLTFEEKTPFLRKESELRPLIVDDAVGTHMYEEAVSILSNGGLHQYEVSAFCRNDMISRHNIGYWTGREFLGLGPSAFSFYGSKRYRNIANLKRYSALVQAGMSPVDFVDDVDAAARRKELLALHLRLLCGVCLSQFEKTFGILECETNKALDSLILRGFLKRNTDHVALTRRGLLFYDTVASEII